MDGIKVCSGNGAISERAARLGPAAYTIKPLAQEQERGGNMTFEEAKKILRNPEGWPLKQEDIQAIEYLIGTVEMVYATCISDTRIEDLGLSVRSQNNLNNAGVRVLGDINKKFLDNIQKLNYKGFGRKSYKEIIAMLEERVYQENDP
jgi:DNA-directed RNA polymerase alpha subunit